MEKVLVGCILLVAAVLLVPGCFSEEVASSGIETTEILPADEETAIDLTGIDGASEETGEEETAEEPVMNATYTADVNVTNMTVPLGEIVTITLTENPTTGYTWNATNSTGLEIISDNYTADDVPAGMVGSGGIHAWMAKAVETGNQTFSAILMRSWEPITGDEETYSLDILVE